MAVKISQTKSTYRNPATVIETKTDGFVKNIEEASKAFANTMGALVELKNNKLQKTLEENKAMIDNIAIDPEKYLERLEQASTLEKQAFYDQANEIFDANTRLTLAIEKGNFNRSDFRALMAKRAEQISSLNQLIGLASSEEMIKKDWIAKAEDRIKNATIQGGASLLGSDFINARNIFAKGMPGTVQRIFKNGVAYYKFDDGGSKLLSEDYKNRLHNAKDFLEGVTPTVPQLDNDFDKLMKAQGLIDPQTGRLTKTAQDLGESGYQNAVGKITASIATTYAQDAQVTKSAWLEIFGKQEALKYSVGRTINEDGKPAGITLSKEDYGKFQNAMNEYLQQYIPLYRPPEPEDKKETASDRGRRVKEEDRKDRLNAFMELFEQRKTGLGISKNKSGVFTGIVTLVEEGKDANNKNAFKVIPARERALNDIGFQILNIDPGVGMTTIALQGEKGDTRIDIPKDMNANDFIRELMKAKGAKEAEAREFAEQFDLNEDGIPDNFESGLSTDIYLEASNFK